VPIDLAKALPILMPRAIAWAEAEERRAMQIGAALAAAAQAQAHSVGVQRPLEVRVAVEDRLPVPADPALRAAADQAGLVGRMARGLTLGHAIFIVSGHELDQGLLRHELRHVHQYEKAGSIAAFLPVYLTQILQFGYANALGTGRP
jgi:hypothetical protein